MPSQIRPTTALALQDPVAQLFSEMYAKCSNTAPTEPSCLGLNRFPIIREVFSRIYQTQLNFDKCQNTIASKSQMIHCTDKKLPGVQLTLSASRNSKYGPTRSLSIYRLNTNELHVDRNTYGYVDADPKSFRMECSLKTLPDNKSGFNCGHSSINYVLEGSEDSGVCTELYTPPTGPTVSIDCQNQLPLLTKYLNKAPIDPIVIPFLSYFKVSAGLLGTAAFGCLTLTTLNNLWKVHNTSIKAKNPQVQKAIDKLRSKALVKNAMMTVLYGTAAVGSYYFANTTYKSDFTGFYHGSGCEGEPIWFK